MNKQLLLTFLLPAVAALPLRAQMATTNTPPPADPPPATMLATAMLASCVATLPREPLELTGSLTVRKQRGIPISEHPFRMHLDWGATPQLVQFALLNTQNQTQQCITIIRRDGVPEREFRSGANLEKQPMPPLSARILDTDMCWLDLTLDFLWWKDVQWEGEGSVLNETCEILLARPPSPIPGCSGVRLWLHRELGFLMKAEQLDPSGKPLRCMSVREVSRDRKFIKELDVVAEKSDFRTRLFVNDP